MFSLFKNKIEEIYNPVIGKIIPLKEIDDGVFSEKLMGEGFAIRPKNGSIFAPIEGTVTSIFPTKHAISIETRSGLEILLHIGLDTVELNGEGFNILVKEGSKISKNTQLAEVSLSVLREKNKRNTIMVVFPEARGKVVDIKYGEFEANKTIGEVKE